MTTRFMCLTVMILVLCACTGAGETPTQTAIPVPTYTTAPTRTSTPAPTPTPLPTPTPTPVPVSGKFVAFTSNRNGQLDLYAASGDGSQLLRLTNDPAAESYLRFSSDGQKMAFLKDVDGEKALFAMNIGEGEAQQLTKGYVVRQYDWSPDSKNLVFTAKDPKAGVYVLPAEGGEPTRLFTGPDDYYMPAWSPDGIQIIFLAGDSDYRRISLINADGTGQQLLNPTSFEELYDVVWSPDGKQIAFSAKKKNSDVYLINLADKSLVNLTDDATADEIILGAYSPNGQWLLFWSSPKERGDIYQINIQTKERQQLTTDPHDDFYPQWSPDGKQIAFGSFRDGNAEIYLSDLESKQEQNLTDFPAAESDAIWYPLEPASNLQALAAQAAAQAIPAPTLSPLPDKGLIIYLAQVDGKTELYGVSPDGTNPAQLTDNNLYEITTDWSPDCSLSVISAFPEDSVFDEDSNLYLINRDGSDLRQATYMSFSALAPQWSPDGSKILFLSDDPGVTDFYILDVRSNKVTKLTPDPIGGDLHSVPWQFKLADWSPDGKWIVYAGPGEVNWDLYKISSDGKESSLLTQDPAAEHYPAWSPDGNRIAFVRYLPEGCTDKCNLEIFVMNSDGRDITQLVRSPKSDYSPIWSPDGQNILFLSDRDGNLEIYVVNEDGKGIKNLTKNKATDYNPVWSPDGGQIVFTSERDGNPELYVMNSDGTGVTRLTSQPDNDYSNAWICAGK